MKKWIDLSDEYTPRQAESMGFLDGCVQVPNPRAKGKRTERALVRTITAHA